MCTGICQGTCKPFFVAGNQVGLIRPDVMKHIQRFPEVCSVFTWFVITVLKIVEDTWIFPQKQ